jgi:hypothetical protein
MCTPPLVRSMWTILMLRPQTDGQQFQKDRWPPAGSRYSSQAPLPDVVHTSGTSRASSPPLAARWSAHRPRGAADRGYRSSGPSQPPHLSGDDRHLVLAGHNPEDLDLRHAEAGAPRS